MAVRRLHGRTAGGDRSVRRLHAGRGRRRDPVALLAMGIADELAAVPLVDQHCHTVVVDALDRSEFELLLTEAHECGPEGTSEFDSQVGLAVRRWCAPVLGLGSHADPDAYLARREALGPEETTRRLLRACGASDLLVDTGLHRPGLCGLPELAELAGARVHQVTRAESVAEELAAAGVGAAELGTALAAALAERASRSVAFKTKIGRASCRERV